MIIRIEALGFTVHTHSVPITIVFVPDNEGRSMGLLGLVNSDQSDCIKGVIISINGGVIFNNFKFGIIY